MIKRILSATLAAGIAVTACAGVVKVGSASYADEFPGAGDAGNRLLTTKPYVTGKAAERPIPTNDWWTSELVNAHGGNIFNYPMGIVPVDAGLTIIRPFLNEAMTAERPFTIGVDGISASETYVSDYTDWTVTLQWKNAEGTMEAVVGQGMPMVYFTKTSGNPVKVTFTSGTASARDNILIVTGCYNQASYAVFAPAGSGWTVDGNTATSTLAGKDYWSAMLLPQDVDAQSAAQYFAEYAFAFPVDTRADGSYDPATGKVRTVYNVTTEAKEGENREAVIGMLPHHWGHLEASSQQPGQYKYTTARGELRVFTGNQFSTELTFRGVIPVLPDFCKDVEGYDREKLNALIDEVIADQGFQDWTDSYNDGLLLNRLTQVARIARQTGYADGLKRATDALKKQLERWLTYETGDTDFMFYYYKDWHTMVGFRAGHGQDSNINDHDFHWGYFVQAALFLGEEDSTWLKNWGGLIDLLVRDANSPDRDDTMFPYLRCFSPYAGHGFANGTSQQPLGADEESTSEAMNFNAAMILWADLRGDTAMRDTAVWVYTTTISAIEEYWFDANGRNFDVAGYNHNVVGILETNWNNYGTYWTNDPGGMHGIQIFPTQASSLYLGENKDMARRHWQSLKNETGVMSYAENPNVWYDTWIRYVALFNHAEAQKLYDNCPASFLGSKFGDSHAHTYYWLNTLATLGTLHDVTADHPLARAFVNYDGDVTYVARNNTSAPITVTFSDGAKLTVAANSLGTLVAEGAVDPTDPDTPDDDPAVDGGCIEVSTEASEGTFTAPYTIGMRTRGTVVTITAKFDGSYSGFAGPWFWDETDGFSETQMMEEDGLYKFTRYGCQIGDEIKFRIKIAFTGGLAVTKQFSYTAGNDCGDYDTPDDDPDTPDNPDDGVSDVTTSSAQSVEYYNLQGIRIAKPSHGGVYIRRQGNDVRKVTL